MGCCASCCQSTPDVPDEILPNPQGQCKFVTKSCSNFNSDYEVYRDFVDKSNRWLFLNQVGQKFGQDGKIQLENYVRGHNSANPKEGEILWTVHYNEKPKYEQEWGDDSDSDDGIDWGNYADIMSGGISHTVAKKFKMEAMVKFEPGVAGGQTYSLKCKAKGVAEREVSRDITDGDGDGLNSPKYQFNDNTKVKKITCKVYDQAGETLDKFYCYTENVNWGKDKLEWDCAAFTASVPGGWGTKEDLVVTTKESADPAMALLMAHLVATVFNPDVIARDFIPDWGFMEWGMYA